ncbi:MAG: TlpA disulfide reductase family protein, partial [Bacteroidota bacterium]
LATYIQAGKASQKLKDRYKEIFLSKTKEEAYEMHLAVLEKEANAKLLEKMREKMIEMPAPEFSLVNMDGQTVSLQDYRGKVVVLDFWATWCGPCKSSFPGMQELLNQMEGNTDVVFLFVDAWQREKSNEEKLKVVREFIADNEYTFNVPMDYDNKVIDSYKVNGIPTKFVIGPNGKIRFKSVGGGAAQKYIKELKLMITLAGQHNTSTAGVGMD